MCACVLALYVCLHVCSFGLVDWSTPQPGSLIEWGEWWSQGIRHRSEDEAVGGWFSQLGKIHQVHHMWSEADHTTPHPHATPTCENSMPMYCSTKRNIILWTVE